MQIGDAYRGFVVEQGNSVLEVIQSLFVGGRFARLRRSLRKEMDRLLPIHGRSRLVQMMRQRGGVRLDSASIYPLHHLGHPRMQPLTAWRRQRLGKRLPD